MPRNFNPLWINLEPLPDYYGQWQQLNVQAEKWQETPSQTSHPARLWVARHVKAGATSILDVGCGIGIDGRFYKDSPVSYLGMDVTPKFVREARRQGTEVVEGSMLDIPFRDDAFDVVYCKDVLVHLQPEEWKKALAEMARVARREVITIEDRWRGRTEYVIAEKYGNLGFWGNTYGEGEVCEYANELGLRVRVYQSPQNVWQITVYGKEGLKHDCSY